MNPNSANYEFSEEQLKYLGGFILLPHDARLEKMNEFFADKTQDYILNMFSQFIDMASVVIENQKDHVAHIRILDGVHPHHAHNMNLPCLMGAIVGYKLTNGIEQNTLCHGCAYRKGSTANTCLTTTHDAHMCHENKEIFYCHENLKEDGETPTRKCRGFLQIEKRNRQHADN